ncbi:MAG: CinA family nicotinamide mononucleotide deamidase-related protein [Planctomycetota bacterium]|jgi:nicotinamide-nucleotide amidase|nr:CinA family nicotinamide mononucleotide deamidase-related protein [Planctomycetota bacterium]
MQQPSVFIISCGDELLFGHTVDTNAAWLANQCTLLGWRVVGKRTIGDVTPEIVAAFREGAEKAQVVLLTGGLGPTEDDRSRHALAEALDVPLEEDAVAMAEIEAVFRRFGHPMGKINRVQALVPRGAERLPNHQGTAPGLHAHLGQADIFVMPGVPREMREMFTETVRPKLLERPAPVRVVLRRLYLLGRGESDIGEALKDLMTEGANPEVGTAVAEGIVTVRLYARGKDLKAAEALAKKTEAKIRTRLGADIFGADQESLPQALVSALRQKKACLVLAESCTGGMLSSFLVDVPGASEVFKEGIVSYSNQAKTNRLLVDPGLIEHRGAVSEEVVVAMAEGAILTSHYPERPLYSLAVTGIAGPEGGSPEKPVGTVWLACSRLDQNNQGLTRSLAIHSVAERQGVRLRSCHAAFDLLRRTLLDLPLSRPSREKSWTGPA